MDGKTKAIISHITLIGWVIALILNSKEKSDFSSFYIRQALGIGILSLFSMIKFIGWIIGIVCIVLWIVSIIGALSGEEKEVPVVGPYFQEWFKGI